MVTGAPLLAFDELVADLSTASIWHRAPVLDALKLVRPAVSLSRDRDGRYNVQDLVDRASAEPDGATPRFSLNNIEVDDGVIAFDDGVAAAPAEASTSPSVPLRRCPTRPTSASRLLNARSTDRLFATSSRCRAPEATLDIDPTRCRSRTTSPTCRRSRASSSLAVR
jgi:uncharacterized protein involved in outer membrane biogenesis